ncbi:TetR/AcrR family transcriptional regulator [Nocardia uniformis]|uniref:TetR/AcrR family transcriptional regulator n=1 Tax=Nocardia uniformis TaxID=53432 RepID=A0A849BZV6_9NOCA|nr:TetR/AcrR family transcriptional regulator [Nocardia uniformis]NNH68299.1 TetR/AcrR family transcriptional regulator [Nocardia uniformis]
MVEKTSTRTATRDRLLTAAETLLLTERYDDVSVRGICTAAGVNPAAVHYHFGSKEALVAALIEDRLGPVWADRLAVVDDNASVSEVVDAVIEPFVELAADPVGRMHLRLLAQLVLGRHPLTWNLHWFHMDSWVGLLPDLSVEDSRRRWKLAFDLIISRFGTGEEISDRSAAALRDFMVAGLTAPKVQQ